MNFTNGMYLIIGGNIGNRLAHIETCKNLIAKEVGTIVSESSVYETASWGNKEQPAFLNQVLLVQTTLKPHNALKTLLGIEQKMGRERTTKWASRIMDIDILFYNNCVIRDEALQIPHPHIAIRKFVLVPLHQIAPEFIHPVFKKSIDALLKECEDNLEVKKLTGSDENRNT